MGSRHDVRIVNEGTAVRLLISGEVDMDSAAEVATQTQKALATHPDALIVDLSQATFLDSAGVGALVGLSNRAQDAAVAVRLAPGPPNVMRVLEMVGLTETFDVI